MKLFTGDEQSETYEYSPDKNIITIGRDKSSDIWQYMSNVLDWFHQF